MSVLDGLQPEFLAKVETLINNCAQAHVVVRPVQGLRTPLQQGADWRQGRDIDTINQQIGILQIEGCHYLAACIEQAGPQNGPLITKAIPGLSWHNFGFACDFMTFDAVGKPIADGTDPSYADFQEQVTLSGLFPVGNPWTWDSGHTQYYQASSPLAMYNLQNNDSKLSALYPLPTAN